MIRKKMIVLALLLVASTLVACTSNSKPADDHDQDDTASTNEAEQTVVDEATDDQEDESEVGKQVLVVYFSATGTTEKLAEYAADAMHADLYEIVPEQPYTSADLDYNDTGSRSSKEMDDPNCRPAIHGSVENMADYDIVFIGYPIWWGEAPRIVNTFVENHDFSGKTVVTFSTSGGSGHNDSTIQSLVTDANWITGARLKRNSSRDDIVKWINGLGLDIQAE